MCFKLTGLLYHDIGGIWGLQLYSVEATTKRYTATLQASTVCPESFCSFGVIAMDSLEVTIDRALTNLGAVLNYSPYATPS